MATYIQKGNRDDWALVRKTKCSIKKWIEFKRTAYFNQLSMEGHFDHLIDYHFYHLHRTIK